MANKPLLNPLPADLPENWQINQIVAPTGAEVGLAEQYGYNYLMAQLNAAQQAINNINEAFPGLAGLVDGKVPLEQLPVVTPDDALSDTSKNPPALTFSIALAGEWQGIKWGYFSECGRCGSQTEQLDANSSGYRCGANQSQDKW